MSIDVSQYFPQSHYAGGIPGVNSYQQANLDSIYGQSFDLTQMSLGAYKSFLGETQDLKDKFEARVGIMEVQGERLKQDLLEAPSIVQQQIKTALDANTKQQATVMASMKGPVARINSLMASKGAEQAQMMASSGVSQFIQEDIARKSMYYQQLATNNQQIITALGGLSQANMQGMTASANMAETGLKSALGAVNIAVQDEHKRMEFDIEQNKLQNEWNQSLLDSQTNMAMNLADNMGGLQQAMLDAQSMQYNSYVTNEAKAYGTQKQHELNVWKAQLDATTKTQLEQMRISTTERLGGLAVEQSAWQTNAQLYADFARQQANTDLTMRQRFDQMHGIIGRSPA